MELAQSSQTSFTQLSQGAGLNSGLDTLGGVVTTFLPWILGISGLVLFFYVIWGGFGIMTAKGDPKATAAAREHLTKALVGFLIVFMAYWLVQLLGLIFGIQQFRSIFS
ncbi:MAG: hypothetical protein A2700_00690 [Candidatus Blackburnbacteria bacterium RIFCSPHIGHO2_01_FULL_44_64]|uniref:Uncharacterized protein n=1 Tax=Candidatus Blackburnbacteria bacterium RIFCSPHIGHO2_02_FULL_44_20 TaxID=1797516 RepID=A0A1G1V5A3_9BACT|nr:MAG: hypothetical protein A2700_00690 [Candidatus Blackburnbacteria bacterium RIFCSPHIGHO2_01_FULL_44_64]OGY10551.1 MAG: hypothetical protein A3D26_00425 [Candidatus Blackburnbacteria bacterium RIFCSPHIGHO2_02_FULL_44_20]OGY11637.1 MAG: hypothetical protein A3E16_01400 [Candidatus Blackburnbacteria bacterium RIFCSPHIGHO2_12_FULL_44_25]OGY14750.1 MAG: hypothetical protein A3A62_03090 [Candidatus Blackburnbacteria bacterium RIFCSPLOWO2_01_FULL_44_43]OGY15578.1 MAG: hypothetical protein A3H88_0